MRCLCVWENPKDAPEKVCLCNGCVRAGLAGRAEYLGVGLRSWG